MRIPETLQSWLVEQLHRTTDNLHIHNLGLDTLTLSLYVWESDKKWKEKALGELKPQEDRWITLKTLSSYITEEAARMQRPVGESALVVRCARKENLAFWRVDNIFDVRLVMYLCGPSGGFSKIKNRGKWQMKLYHAQPEKYNYGWIHWDDETKFPDVQWECWFEHPPIRIPYEI